MDNVARRKEGAKQHAFLVYGVRFGTASEKNEIKIENVEIDLKTTKPDAKGVMAIFGARSRKTANDNKISIINTNFTGDTKRVGLIVGATVDAYISSFSERDVTKQPPPEGANRNVIEIRGSTIPGGGLIAAWYYDHDKAKVDTTKLRFEENRIEIHDTKLGAQNIFVVRDGMPILYDGTAENNHLVIVKNVTEVDGSTLSLANLWVASGGLPMKNFKGNTFDLSSPVITESFGGA